jgi:hypothetical protein
MRLQSEQLRDVIMSQFKEMQEYDDIGYKNI